MLQQYDQYHGQFSTVEIARLLRQTFEDNGWGVRTELAILVKWVYIDHPRQEGRLISARQDRKATKATNKQVRHDIRHYMILDKMDTLRQDKIRTTIGKASERPNES